MRNSKPTTPNHWRPRFSVRTLVVLVTLVCCYAACWGPTKTRGVVDVIDHVAGNYVIIALSDYDTPDLDLTCDAMAKTPLVVSFTEPFETRRHYYFWFFGYVAKLPYERDVPVNCVW